MSTTPLVESRPWKALEALAKKMKTTNLRTLFLEQPDRGTSFVIEHGDLYVDFSKQQINADILEELLRLADHVGLADHRDAMFRGDKINTSENRSVLHIALRLPRSASLVVDGVDVVAQVHAVLDAMDEFAAAVRSGTKLGFTGKKIRNIVNIGIGGSDLGPAMAYEALRFYESDDLAFRFVSNVDEIDLQQATVDLDPAETLFIVSSKTFGTLETLTNALSAKDWITSSLGDERAVADHFAAISTNVRGAEAFGVHATNVFGFWDWVGGRYSMDSAIGLSTLIALGREQFDALLEGFRAMDEHFLTAPFEKNLPVVMGLLAIWNRNFMGRPTTGVMPYDQRLKYFPAYLQQLTMESNGKSVTCEGHAISYETGAIYWGDRGTNGQHSFYQLLHQGTTVVPIDFIGFGRSTQPLGNHHNILMSNVFAQSQALAFGKTAEELRAEGTPDELVPHRVMPGNRPSTVILAPKITPRLLGQLVALYEHSVFVQGTVWGIDSFDQWGVELGKVLAASIIPELSNDVPLSHDSSTNALIRHYRSLNEGENERDND